MLRSRIFGFIEPTYIVSNHGNIKLGTGIKINGTALIFPSSTLVNNHIIIIK